MSISAFSIAKGALQLGAGGETSFEEGMFDGRDVTHWSSHLLAGGAIIGLVAMLAAIALNQLIISVLGGILLATNVIGSYYIGKFAVFHAADEVIMALSKRVHAFWTQNVKLDEEVKEAEFQGDRIAAITKNFDAITKENKKLQKEKELGLKNLRIEHAKWIKLKKACEPLASAMDQFIKVVGNLSKEEAQFDQNSKELISSLNELFRFRDDFNQALEQIENAKKKFSIKPIQEITKKVELLLNNFSEKYRALEAQNNQFKEELAGFEDIISKMNQVNNQTKILTKKIAALQKKRH